MGIYGIEFNLYFHGVPRVSVYMNIVCADIIYKTLITKTIHAANKFSTYIHVCIISLLFRSGNIITKVP